VRIARNLAIVFLALVGVVVLALVAFFVSQPTAYRITRTASIGASPATVHAHLDDVRALAAWDPWRTSTGVGPVTTTFSPDPVGVGAWIDRRAADGSGARTTITEITDTTVVLTSETSGALGAGHSTQTFALANAGSGTVVVWTLGSDLHGLGRALWPFVHLEERVGPEMEAGLSRLDRACR
jgi:hypothetical protein